MTSPHFDDRDDEAPLDPAAERVRRKLVRLLVVSFGIMVLGLGAVIAAIVYKINEGNDDPAMPAAQAGRLDAQSAIAGSIDLPAGARIVSSSLDGDRALIAIALPDGAMQLVVIDLPSGNIIVRHDLATR